MKFSENIAFSFKTVFKNLGLFLPLVLIFGLLGYLIPLLILRTDINSMTNFSDTEGILLVLVSIISIFVGILQSLSMLTASSSVLAKKPVTAIEAISKAFSRFKEAVILFFRIFWYVFKWSLVPLLGILLFFAILAAFTSATAASAHTIFDTPSLPKLPNGIISVLYIPLALAAFVFTLLTIYAGISRGIRSTFSFYALIEDKLDNKKALEKSIKTVYGRFWNVFGTIVFGTLAITLVFIIPFEIIASPFLNPENTRGIMIYNAISLLISTFAATISITFINNYYNIIKNNPIKK